MLWAERLNDGVLPPEMVITYIRYADQFLCVQKCLKGKKDILKIHMILKSGMQPIQECLFVYLIGARRNDFNPGVILVCHDFDGHIWRQIDEVVIFALIDVVSRRPVGFPDKGAHSNVCS